MITFLALIALILSLVLTGYVRELMRKAGIVGRDIHKPERPEVPEMGGIAIVLTVGVLGALVKPDVLPVFLLFGLVGVIDDLTALRQSHKVVLSLLVSIPVAFLDVGRSVDIFGYNLNLGILYPVFAVLFVTGSANLVNMLAGFNGLEVGTSAIALGFLALMTDGTARELALIGLGASLGFLWWNRYPARVFPGDTGTLSLGALIGLVGILGKVEVYTAILLIPHFLDFTIKALSVRFGVRRHGRTEVMPDGTLKAPPYPSFLGTIMRRVRVTEPKLVAIVWGIEFTLGLLAWALSQLL
ncbi:MULTISPECIES: glycosyltransferase 4 family protein [Thermococcus]|uniref:UDP-N-acetylmuramyl pentapeptide phosphotransferase/UDP-N-acetylglucosamine-1-phosphate transferase n=1 Tax=Thermococcus nautili TaxID=195522 RepID=W8NUE3_9EURY|nr:MULTISPECIES: glycosyltransferase 4 family protein [Thermococcus]AHL22893.1 UDP-N-acetylmuramyl pentapeptide phosphotransferase/UDP-N-acetylglucosamine-1-phosphate transferase [Thermococcus nautili]NJE49820.1 UDP-N-acetylglucosamine--dolichyl-phosphate N-acetylglucosaminephosphotransferase [Thermococcus sp. 9N3]